MVLVSTNGSPLCFDDKYLSATSTAAQEQPDALAAFDNHSRSTLANLSFRFTGSRSSQTIGLPFCHTISGSAWRRFDRYLSRLLMPPAFFAAPCSACCDRFPDISAARVLVAPPVAFKDLVDINADFEAVADFPPGIARSSTRRATRN
jgi:hypothetical protein